MFRGGINSLQVELGQNILVSHGVLYCVTALRKLCCSSRLMTVLMMVLGRGCVQHLGGILDSSAMACLVMTARHSPQ